MNTSFRHIAKKILTSITEQTTKKTIRLNKTYRIIIFLQKLTVSLLKKPSKQIHGANFFLKNYKRSFTQEILHLLQNHNRISMLKESDTYSHYPELN